MNSDIRAACSKSVIKSFLAADSIGIYKAKIWFLLNVERFVAQFFKPVPKCWPLIHNKRHRIKWIGNHTGNRPTKSSNKKQPSKFFRKTFTGVFRSKITIFYDSSMIKIYFILSRYSFVRANRSMFRLSNVIFLISLGFNALQKPL